MKKYRYKKLTICVHGVDKNRPEPCPICKASNAYAKKDVESLARRFDNRKPANFTLAVDIKNRFNQWQKMYKIKSFDYYLHELEESGNFKFKISTLKHAYYVAKAFPDLEDQDKRKLSFSAYSEIANSRISQEEKRIMRQQAEAADHMTVNKIRNMIAKKMKGRTIKERFRYESKERFLNDVDSFIKENIDLYGSGVEIHVSIKPLKKPFLTGRAVDEDVPGGGEDRI